MATATLEIIQPVAEEPNLARGPAETVLTPLPEGTSWPAQVPGEVLLGSLADPRLRVTVPLRVRFAKDEGHVVAEALGLDEFGFGTDVLSARHDLQRALVELFFTLEREHARLGSDLLRVWETLRRAVTRTR